MTSKSGRLPHTRSHRSFAWRDFPWLESEFARARWMYIIGITYMLVGYLGTNELAALNPWNRPALPISTGFDQIIPFTPWMVIFYILYYPILATPLLFAADAVSITRLTLAQVTTQSIAYVVFLAFPTPIERPPAVPVEGVFHSLLDLLFRADHPYNTFPSMHVAQSCIVAVFFMKYAGVWPFGEKSRAAIRANRIAVAILWFHGFAAITVSASAVLIKQHYVADAAAGFLLAGLMSVVFFRKDLRLRAY